MLAVLFLLLAAAEPTVELSGPRVAWLSMDSAQLPLGSGDDIRTELTTMAAAMSMTMLPADQVQRSLSDAVASGLRCPLWETACAARAAVALEVDAVLVVRLAPLPDGLWMWAQLTRAVGGSRRVSVLLDGPHAVPLRTVWERLTSVSEQAPLMMPVLVVGDARIDDQATAAAPLSTWVSPGTHVLSNDAATSMVVVPAHGDRMEIRVIEMTEPLPVGPLLLGTVGVGIAAAAGTSLAIASVGALSGGNVDGTVMAVAAGAALVGGAAATAAAVWWLLID